VSPVVRKATAIAADQGWTPTTGPAYHDDIAIVAAPPLGSVRYQQQRSGSGGMCMTATGTPVWSGQSVTLQPCSDDLWDRQLFTPTSPSNGTWSLQSWYDTGYLDTDYGQTSAGTRLVIGDRTDSSTQFWVARNEDS
jgi:hypothetical protein